MGHPTIQDLLQTPDIWGGALSRTTSFNLGLQLREVSWLFEISSISEQSLLMHSWNFSAAFPRSVPWYNPVSGFWKSRTLVIAYSKPTQSLKKIHMLNQHNAKGYSVFQEFLHLFISGFLLQQALLPGNLVKEVGLVLIQPPHHVLCHHENRDAEDVATVGPPLIANKLWLNKHDYTDLTINHIT